MTGIEVPRDHAGLEELSEAECLTLAAGQPVGRLAFSDGDRIEVLPVNHVVVDGMVAFRSAEGSKLGAATEGAAVAFEVDEYDARRHKGWSVVVKGHLTAVSSPTVLALLRASRLQPWRNRLPRPVWLVVEPDVVTGRRL
ncbi:MAG TPA: pyridoxamine 5'-phosphate oxidase family protein [Mycobacteriales bacterium]